MSLNSKSNRNFRNRVRTADWSAHTATTVPIITAENVPVSKRTILRSPKTAQEKILCYSLCFLFIVMMVFLAALCIISERWKATLSKMPHFSDKEDVECQTDVCKETAQNLLSNIDPTADPCDDFYQYACGGWMKNNPIPKGREVFMAYDMRSQEVRKIVVDLLRNSSSDGTKPRTLDTVGKFFRGCTDAETRNKISVEPMIRLLKDFGGWPMVDGDKWSASGFNWYKQTARVNRELYLDVFVEIDVIQTVVKSRMSKVILLQEGPFIFSEPFYEGVLQGNYSNSTTEYMEFIAEAAQLLGSEMDKEQLIEEAKQMILFECNLRMVEENFGRDIHGALVGEIDENVTAFLNRYPDFTYREFLNLHIKSDTPVKDSTFIYAADLDYLQRLPVFIEEIDTRIVANYIAYWIVNTFASYTLEDLWTLTYSSHRNWTSEKVCTSITKTFMSEAISRLFIDKYFPPLTRYHVNKMIEMIRLAYSSTLDQNNWMDKNTMLYTLVKLQSIESMIGYPEWIADDNLLDKHYEKVLDIDEDDFFGAIVKLCILKSEHKFNGWNGKIGRNNTVKTSAITVNAFYIPRSNFMVLPAGILGYPFYKYGRIDSMNYGGIGTVIGHEISHAFDDYGSQFDHEGKRRNWWTEKTKMKFEEKAKCFEEQYENYVDDDHPLKVDGSFTLGENIADNGAIRNAFKAFRLHLALSDEDMTNRQTLPGLSATPEQLFFLGYASVWCANMTDDYARGFKHNDVHSPNELRVNIPLANFIEFARAFKCNPGTRMNPKHKCILW